MFHAGMSETQKYTFFSLVRTTYFSPTLIPLRGEATMEGGEVAARMMLQYLYTGKLRNPNKIQLPLEVNMWFPEDHELLRHPALKAAMRRSLSLSLSFAGC
jgi:hypothetical protein